MSIAKQTQKKKGFTIIEVVLVLAIAGLIFLMVFVALPTLQRNQRNIQRKQDIDRFKTAVDQYIANNNKLPFSYGDVSARRQNGTDNRFDTGFITRYIDSSCIYDKEDTGTYGDAYYYYTECDDQFKDPDGTIYRVGIKNGNNENIIYSDDIDHFVVFVAGDKCTDSETDSIKKTNKSKTYLISYTLEGGAHYCIDNS